MKLKVDRLDVPSTFWASVFTMGGLGVLLASGLGFFSLLLIGLLLAAACAYAELTLDMPLLRWTAARFYRPSCSSDEPSVARAAFRQTVTPQLRVGLWCGLALAIAGLAGI